MDKFKHHMEPFTLSPDSSPEVDTQLLELTIIERGYVPGVVSSQWMFDHPQQFMSISLNVIIRSKPWISISSGTVGVHDWRTTAVQQGGPCGE